MSVLHTKMSAKQCAKIRGIMYEDPNTITDKLIQRLDMF